MSTQTQTHTVYICGKMTGLPDYNRPQFNAAAAQLRATGHIVHNPAEIAGQPDWEWSDYMRHALKAMLECDTLFVLTGYQTSKGATIEIELAGTLGMPVIYQ